MVENPWCLEPPLPWRWPWEVLPLFHQFLLLVLRLLNGVFSGFVPNSTALIASQVPKDQSGYALGTLSTGVVAGTLMGPLIGVTHCRKSGECAMSFLGRLLLIFGFLLTFWGIEEEWTPSKRRTKSSWQLLRSIQQKRYPLGPLDQHDHPNDRPIYFSDPAFMCGLWDKEITWSLYRGWLFQLWGVSSMLLPVGWENWRPRESPALINRPSLIVAVSISFVPKRNHPFN